MNRKIKSLGMENIKIISPMKSINHSKEGLPLETSASETLLLRWPIHIIKSVDKTKFSC